MPSDPAAAGVAAAIEIVLKPNSRPLQRVVSTKAQAIPPQTDALEQIPPKWTSVRR
jgi:hypothetical protein